MSYTQITVSGTFKAPDNTLCEGRVTFQLSEALQDTAGNVIATREPVICVLSSGAFTTTLFATDDTGVIPTGVTYLVTEEISGAPPRSYEIQLPKATTTVNIADVAPATSTPSYSYVLQADYTAKGDLLVGTGTAAYDQLAVGADGYVLTADSAEPAGVKWSASVAGVDAEQVRDIIATALVAGSNVTITVDDPGDTITIASTAGGGGLTSEQVHDLIDSHIVAGSGIDLTVDDPGDTLTVVVDPSEFGAGTVPLAALDTDVATQAEFDAHVNDASDAHDASAISNVAAGNIVATDVQAAINELDTEKVAKAGDTMTGQLQVKISPLSSVGYYTSNATDAAARLEIQTGGTVGWGDGSAAVDVTLFRNGAGDMRLSGAGLLNVRTSSTATAFGTLLNTDTVGRFVVRTDGQMTWGPGGASSRDTNLYRSAADTLKTDDTFDAAAITIGGTALNEVIDDRVAALLTAGTNITLTYNDVANTLTIDATGGSGAVATDVIWDAKGDLAVGTGANTAQKLTVGTNGYHLVAASGETTGLKWQQRKEIIRCTIDGGGTVLTTGAKTAYGSVAWPCTIDKVRLLADVSGSVTLDIWKDSYANFPPVDADSMPGAGTKPSLSAAQKSELTVSGSGWTTTTLAEGDVLEFEVESATTVTKLVVELFVTVTY